MKKLILMTIMVALMAVPAMAVPTLEFAKTGPTGGWFFDGASTISFAQPLEIIAVQGAGTDALFGAYVYLPSMTVGGSSGAWTLSGGTISIKSAADGTGDILTGTLSAGDLVPTGTSADGYTFAGADITWSLYPGSPYSAVADALFANINADIDLAFSAGAAVPGGSFDAMLNGAGDFNDGLTGTITIPAPGAMILGGIGVSFVGWLRRRRSL